MQLGTKKGVTPHAAAKPARRQGREKGNTLSKKKCLRWSVFFCLAGARIPPPTADTSHWTLFICRPRRAKRACHGAPFADALLASLSWLFSSSSAAACPLCMPQPRVAVLRLYPFLIVSFFLSPLVSLAAGARPFWWREGRGLGPAFFPRLLSLLSCGHRKYTAQQRMKRKRFFLLLSKPSAV